jgi:hypothetical protein
VQQLAEVLRLDHVFIAEHINDELQTLAFYSRGQWRPQVSYPPHNPPCSIILADGSYCSSQVCQQFPGNPHLQRMKADGYVGVVLTNGAGTPLGTLCGITETIITLASQLGLNAIAEGIETKAQLDRLNALGCTLGQGYLFAAPLAPAAAEALVAQL